MKQLFNEKHRKITTILLMISALLLATALIVGISDNLPGIILCYLSMAGFIMMFVHYWRRAKSFLNLLLLGVISLFVFGILHNLMYALQEMAAGTVVLVNLISFVGVVSFLIALFLCPPAIVIGILGSIVCYFKQRKT